MARVNPSAKIYLKFGSQKVLLPVNPEEISISFPTDNKDYDVIGTGQVVVQRKPAPPRQKRGILGGLLSVLQL